MKERLKVRLFKALILPVIMYPIIPIHTCSNNQIERLKKIQKSGIRWISNIEWTSRTNLETRREILRIEDIMERLKRLAQDIWKKIEEENGDFFIETDSMNMIRQHARFSSSYEAAYA